MMKLKAYTLIGATLCSPALSDIPHAGQVSWDTGVASFSEVLCGSSEDDFIMSARSMGVELRLGFKGDGTKDSIDFSNPPSVELLFTDVHIYSGQSFAQYQSMGEIDANPDGAVGALSLLPASEEAQERRPGGMQISYELQCGGALF